MHILRISHAYFYQSLVYKVYVLFAKTKMKSFLTRCLWKNVLIVRSAIRMSQRSKVINHISQIWESRIQVINTTASLPGSQSCSYWAEYFSTFRNLQIFLMTCQQLSSRVQYTLSFLSASDLQIWSFLHVEMTNNPLLLVRMRSRVYAELHENEYTMYSLVI